MRSVRQCSRQGCQSPAVATLTYVYADSTAVLGPLAQHAEPHCYDLCEDHANRMSVPRGWSVLHIDRSSTEVPMDHNDLYALASAVKEAKEAPELSPEGALERSGSGEPIAPTSADGPRRGHLRILPPQG
ncbi:DUF3499 domain-containing protein [Neomicrococcus lactis]|uniref:DUF3499 domain-containing protein n=1 Tax=Neomicrococcus lactis TaxID=732241 RepID=UPI0022FFFC41|nr:DUF3499 domain-containing protein [Neomicrococcus lactis]